jgi:regulatory protein
MKISDIKQQQKRPERVSIYVDGKYSFSLNQDQLISSGIHKDQEVTSGELEQLKNDSLAGKAYERVIRYLAIRPRSRWEIETYLARKQYAPQLISQLVERLEAKGYIDDVAFARFWVENRLLTKPSSQRRLFAELRQKRVDSLAIEEIMAELDDTSELKQLQKLIERKRRLSRYQDPEKLTAYLARQGFRYDLIKQVLE